MSEIALVDHKEIVNRAFESLQYQPEYFGSKLHTEMAGSVTNGMQLHSELWTPNCALLELQVFRLTPVWLTMMSFPHFTKVNNFLLMAYFC